MTKCPQCGFELPVAPNSEQEQLWAQMAELEDKLRFSFFENGIMLGQMTAFRGTPNANENLCDGYSEEQITLREQINSIIRQLKTGASSPKNLTQPC